MGCGETAGPIALPTARIDYVDGAVEPILVRGQALVIEGFGFGAAQGTGRVRFLKAGGGVVDALIGDSASWSDLAVRTTVPDSAVSGLLTLSTATGRRLTAAVHVLPRIPFDPATLAWQARAAFPRAPVGVALAAAEYASGGTVSTTLFAAGGAEPVGGDSLLAPDSGVYVARALPGGAINAWARQRDTTDAARSRVLPAPRAFAAAAVATRHNSRFTGNVLYVIGGIDATGRVLASVFGADIGPDSVVGRFITVEPLPAPVAGAIGVMRRGRVYVIGGTDSLGHPQRTVYVGRVGTDGHIDGWYQQPLIPAPRAYGGGVVLDGRAVAFGGVSDSVAPGGGLDAAPTRLASTDTAPLSLVSGFFTGVWGPGGALLPTGRSQFATLDLGNVALVVGGMYAGAAGDAAETLAAGVGGDSIGPFAGPVGTNSIAGLAGGTLVGPAAVAWHDADGTRHGLVLGGMDLQTRLRRAGTWGF
ncbi:MAG: hypothetical protein HYS40_01225 [Gemmatimonadetes bacterium]|nr:hypothetical protein [Gemmatimonadota bacterium]